MTSKRNEIKKVPLYIFFQSKQIPKRFKNIIFEKHSSYSIFISDEKILIDLSAILNLDLLQKNHKLLLIGQAVSSKCKAGSFFVEYFGCRESEIMNFFLGWKLGNYVFEKYKSKKKKKSISKICHKKEKELKIISDTYYFVRDLINMPANILGPKEIYLLAKKFLKKFEVTCLIDNQKLEKNFPLIAAVGRGSEKKKSRFSVNLV